MTQKAWTTLVFLLVALLGAAAGVGLARGTLDPTAMFAATATLLGGIAAGLATKDRHKRDEAPNEDPAPEPEVPPKRPKRKGG